MYLRSLTLKGFKSFAEPTTLEFEPGLTVVVGPNGSGKSNVVDAVAWVLGTQGPRSVRSSKMDDVIFAGTANRPALGRAEVSLTIDNSDGQLPLDFSELTVTRTLFRSSGESEYALNGVPCRLIDLQELLSDTGMGRQQHVIVSQGQLDAVLDARPEDRRLIIEEAAGILKFRRRKEKAERRLEGTEANLLRLTDLLREVGRQVRPLERQAAAARRHDGLVEELRALRLYLHGRELASLRSRGEAAGRDLAPLAVEEASVRAQLGGLDTAIAGAERALAAAGGSSLAEAVGRLEAVRERARGLGALLAERQRSVERDRAVAAETTLVASLEADASRLRAELAAVEEAGAGLPARFAELVAAEAEVAAERERLADADTDADGTGPAPVDRAGEVRGELAAVRAGVDRGRAEVARLENRLAALEQRAARLASEVEVRTAEAGPAADAEQRLAAAVSDAEAAREAAATALATAEDAARTAAADRQAQAARTEVLTSAVAEARARVEAGRLSAADDGVLGTLLELVEVDPGWEAAFEAAAAGALGSVVVDGVATARRLLSAPGPHETTATLLALGTPGGRRPDVPPDCPGRPVRHHVRSASAGVSHALDLLLAGVVVVDGGWAEAVDVTLAHPDVVAVTRAGDRFSPAGWQLRAGGPGAARAALDDARRRLHDATAAVDRADAEVATARAALHRATAEAGRLASELRQHVERRQAAAEALARFDSERRAAAAEAEGVRSALARQAERLNQETVRAGELEASLPALEAEETAHAERIAAQRSARQGLQERVDVLTGLRTELERRRSGLDDRRTYLAVRLADVEERLDRSGADRAASRVRAAELDLLLTRTRALASVVAERRSEVEAALAGARERRRRQADEVRRLSARLDGLRRDRQAGERALEEVRERARRAELDQSEAAMRLEAAVDTVRRELDCEPDTAVAAECPPLPPGASPTTRRAELERELRLLGPVNPLALEELAALQERHAFLTAQLDDVKASRRDLAKVIRAVESEMVQLLAAAYADVADHFARLFETLFPGGQGRLRLTDPDDLLSSGIEVEARPAGKNVRKLSLLSGGERSLCALAYLFAVFRSRPSPFYLLDEVEAALDDVNLHRFLDLVAEFRSESQLLVVTHQKRTMEAADCLYGVTMQPGGSSKVLSERVRRPQPARQGVGSV